MGRMSDLDLTIRAQMVGWIKDWGPEAVVRSLADAVEEIEELSMDKGHVVLHGNAYSQATLEQYVVLLKAVISQGRRL